MQHGVFWWEIARPPGHFREKKQQQSQVRLNKNVFTDVDNRERAKALDKKNREGKFRSRKNMKIGGEKMRNASGQQGENEQQ